MPFSDLQMSFCRYDVNRLFNKLVAPLRALVNFKISGLSCVGSARCRMAGFERQVGCKRFSLLIAVCLLCAFVPVAGCQQYAPEDNKERANQNMISSLRSPPIPNRILASQISERNVVAGAKAENALADMLEMQAVSSTATGKAQVQPVPQVLLTFPEEVSEADFDESSIKQIRGSDVNRADIAATGASQKQALLASTKLLKGDYQKERLKKGHTTGQTSVSHGYIKVKRFQLIEEVEREMHLKKPQNMVSHGLIRVRPLELMEAVEEKSNLQNQEITRQSEATAGMAALRRRAGMFWEKAEASEHGLPKLSSSRLGLGETIEQEQIRNVVAALRRAGLFAAIAGTIEGLNLLMLSQLATIFVPTDSACENVKQADRNLQLFQYHIVMPRYTFPQLCSLREGDILYTLLPGCTIAVTGRQNPFKLTLDDVTLIAPNLYLDETIAVHGVDGIFNSTIYGKSPASRHVPGVAPPPAEAPANVSDKQPLLSSPPPAQEPGPSSNNGSAAGALQQGQLSPPTQQNADAGQNATPPTTNDTKSFPFSSSPLASEFASDIDASDDPSSAKFGACAAATAIVCVMSILCC